MAAACAIAMLIVAAGFLDHLYDLHTEFGAWILHQRAGDHVARAAAIDRSAPCLLDHRSLLRFDYTWIMTAGVAGAVLVLMARTLAACVSLPSAISAW